MGLAVPFAIIVGGFIAIFLAFAFAITPLGDLSINIATSKNYDGRSNCTTLSLCYQ